MSIYRIQRGGVGMKFYSMAEWSSYECGGVHFEQVEGAATIEEAVELAGAMYADPRTDVYRVRVMAVGEVVNVDLDSAREALLAAKKKADIDAETAKRKATYERLKAEFEGT